MFVKRHASGDQHGHCSAFNRLLLCKSCIIAATLLDKFAGKVGSGDQFGGIIGVTGVVTDAETQSNRYDIPVMFVFLQAKFFLQAST